MKTNRILSKALSPTLFGSLFAIFLTACSQDAPLAPDPKNDYTVSWIKAFGLIDKDQNWNMVSRGVINTDDALSIDASIAKIYVMNASAISEKETLLGVFDANQGNKSTDWISSGVAADLVNWK